MNQLHQNAPSPCHRDAGGYRLVIDLVDKGPTRFKLAQRSLKKDGYAVTSAGHKPPKDASAEQADIRQPTLQSASVSGQPSSTARPVKPEMDYCH